MKLRTLIVVSLALIPWTETQAITLLASYGAFERDSLQRNFYTLEASSTGKSFTDFELMSVNHIDKETINDSLEVVSRGLGFDFEPLRINLDLGYLFALDTYARDEIDYAVSRSIAGVALSIELGFLELRGFTRSYIPYAPAKTRIDSFDLSFNPSPYQESQVGLSLPTGPFQFELDLGRFDRLQGRYDIVGDNFMLTLPPLSYAKAALTLQGKNHTVLRAEAHKILDDHERRDDFHKLIGSAMHRDAYDGGSLGIGFAF